MQNKRLNLRMNARQTNYRYMQKAVGIAAELFSSALDFIFPRECVLCGKINPDGKFRHVCEDCEQTIRILDGARCTRCSEPIGPKDMPNVHGCPHCFDRKLHFDKSLCVCSFDGAPRRLLHELKYRNGTFALDDLAAISAQFPEAGEFISGAILVPVPLHFLRKIKRKYNQSELIAKMFADTFPKANARVADVLKRSRRTPTQTTLDKEARAANIKNAFEIRSEKRIKDISKDANIVIVDDVMTSGATLSECAKTLKRAGFKNVSALAFARRI